MHDTPSSHFVNATSIQNIDLAQNRWKSSLCESSHRNMLWKMFTTRIKEIITKSILMYLSLSLLERSQVSKTALLSVLWWLSPPIKTNGDRMLKHIRLITSNPFIFSDLPHLGMSGWIFPIPQVTSLAGESPCHPWVNLFTPQYFPPLFQYNLDPSLLKLREFDFSNVTWFYFSRNIFELEYRAFLILG